MKKNANKKGNLLGVGQTVVEIGGVAAGAVGGALAADHFDLTGGTRLLTIGGGAVGGYCVGKGIGAGMNALLGGSKGERERESNKSNNDGDDDESSSSSLEDSSSDENNNVADDSFFTDEKSENNATILQEAETEDEVEPTENIYVPNPEEEEREAKNDLAIIESTLDADIRDINNFLMNNLSEIEESYKNIHRSQDEAEFTRIKTAAINDFTRISNILKDRIKNIELSHNERLKDISTQYKPSVDAIVEMVTSAKCIAEYKLTKLKNECTADIKRGVAELNAIAITDIVNIQKEINAKKDAMMYAAINRMDDIDNEYITNANDFAALDTKAKEIMNRIDTTPYMTINADSVAFVESIERDIAILDIMHNEAFAKIVEAMETFISEFDSYQVPDNKTYLERYEEAKNRAEKLNAYKMSGRAISVKSRLDRNLVKCKNNLHSAINDAINSAKAHAEQGDTPPESEYTVIEKNKTDDEKIAEILARTCNEISSSISRMEKKVDKNTSMYRGGIITVEGLINKLNSLYKKIDFGVNTKLNEATEAISAFNPNAKEIVQSALNKGLLTNCRIKLDTIKNDIVTEFTNVKLDKGSKFYVNDIVNTDDKAEAEKFNNVADLEINSIEKRIKDQIAITSEENLKDIRDITNQYKESNTIDNSDSVAIIVDKLNEVTKSFIDKMTLNIKTSNIDALDKISANKLATSEIIARCHNLSHTICDMIVSAKEQFSDNVVKLIAPIKSIGVSEEGFYVKDINSVPEKIGKLNYTNFTEQEAEKDESDKPIAENKVEEKKQAGAKPYSKKLTRRQRKALNQKN